MILWRQIIGRGFDCFYPQLYVQPVNPRSRKIIPYFPGYLFLHMDLEETGVSILQWMPFSSGFVSFSGSPATVPDNLVQAIRRHVDEINSAGFDPVASLKRGDEVIIESGPFERYEAVFDVRLPGEERVRVLLKLLQDRQVNLVLPKNYIRRKK